MIGIHECHRKLAKIAQMSTVNGVMVMGIPELRLIMPLLRENLELMQKLDSLKELAFYAHTIKDYGWEQDLCRQIDDLEAKLI
ncbi:hypothetical protein KZ483_24250 [Paenibacillus sp. sptzw28]|uniref:DUF7667 family protein n=1 Tax=Paenibacillus sp. sptzw28 TaxID=715179 RepID=UPI001C6F2BA8|nr:hypothetical protein [Paenibacillus sp. sptzw28]QYR20833.1 hypothetical protein KZ483_24250 [Paenibacillus sp. sptzw28]